MQTKSTHTLSLSHGLKKVMVVSKHGVACRIYIDECAGAGGGYFSVVFLFTGLLRGEFTLVSPSCDVVGVFQDCRDLERLRLVESLSLQQYFEWFSSRQPLFEARCSCRTLGLDFASIVKVAGYIGLLTTSTEDKCIDSSVADGPPQTKNKK